ncbi:MAG TPA: hypothetical protein VHD76_09100 [Bryobacteraceae bacterium]|nr:hypothetical protein [Bryobacteraceae bacterium]
MPLWVVGAGPESKGCIAVKAAAFRTEYRHRAGWGVLKERATLVPPGARRLLPGVIFVIVLVCE